MRRIVGEYKYYRLETEREYKIASDIEKIMKREFYKVVIARKTRHTTSNN